VAVTAASVANCDGGNHAAPLIADVFLRRQQVFAQAGVFVQFLQLVLAASALIKDAQAIAHDIDALIVARKAAAHVSQNLLAQRNGLIYLVDGAKKRSKIVGRSNRGRRFGAG